MKKWYLSSTAIFVLKDHQINSKGVQKSEC